MDKNNLLSNVSSGTGGMAMGLIGSAASGAISSYYNERAAEKAYERSKDYFDYVAAYNTPEQQKKRLKDAGLSVGLMYGQAGSTGTQQAVGAPQATVDTSDKAGGLGLQAMMVQKQMQLIDSQINKNNADANKGKSETETIDKMRNTLVENLRQTGIAQWMQNLKNQAIDWNQKDEFGKRVGMTAESDIYGTYEFDFESQNGEQLAADLLTTLADAGNSNAQALLSNTKAKGYWQELLNAMNQADAAKTQAAANKLKAEFDTGEFVNWKQIVEVGGEALKLGVEAAKMIKGGKGITINK